PYRPARLAWYVERVEAARALLESDYAARHTLTTLARFAGMSPFHFARVFREFAGTPPHRYLIRVRLARASERLRDGAGVTDACYASGFDNLSHFIRLFRRAYGVSPSQFAPASSGRGERATSRRGRAWPASSQLIQPNAPIDGAVD
ncbi:MAG: helix-turn-helix transcriptional regulator, partial [Acidobacteriota bacterium]|nr:helix-turn-helix transcriptional regulator [Acidobacteriota bacterium]